MVVLRRKHTSDYHLGQNVITTKDRDDLVIFGTEKNRACSDWREFNMADVNC